MTIRDIVTDTGLSWQEIAKAEVVRIISPDLLTVKILKDRYNIEV